MVQSSRSSHDCASRLRPHTISWAETSLRRLWRSLKLNQCVTSSTKPSLVRLLCVKLFLGSKKETPWHSLSIAEKQVQLTIIHSTEASRLRDLVVLPSKNMLLMRCWIQFWWRSLLRKVPWQPSCMQIVVRRVFDRSWVPPEPWLFYRSKLWHRCQAFQEAFLWVERFHKIHV